MQLSNLDWVVRLNATMCARTHARMCVCLFCLCVCVRAWCIFLFFVHMYRRVNNCVGSENRKYFVLFVVGTVPAG